jgi:tetratricopeptide (TPR) repeat protein
LNVFGFHLVNLAIHIINSLLVYWLAYQILGTPATDGRFGGKEKAIIALLTAFLFVAHPVQTEAITYIMARFTSLAALFYLAATNLFMLFLSARNRRSGSLRRSFYYGLMLICFTIGLKVKEHVVTFPLLALVLSHFFHHYRIKAGLLCLWPIFLLTLIIPISMEMTGLPLGNVVGFGGNVVAENISSFDKDYINSTADRFDYLQTQPLIILKYIQLLILPVGQNADHAVPLIDNYFSLKVILPTLLIVLVLGWALLSFKNAPKESFGPRVAAFGLLWFFITLSVESSIIPLPLTMAEYRLYLPSVGLFFLVALAGINLYFRLRGRQRSAFLAAVLLLALSLSVATHNRNAVWQTRKSLWADVVQKSPENSRGRINYAAALNDDGLYQQAISEGLVAIGLSPDMAGAYHVLGASYTKLRNYDKALENLQVAIAKDPNHYRAWYDMGKLYSDTGDQVNALKTYQKSLEINPNLGRAHNNIALIYKSMGNLDKANEHLRIALRLLPGNLAVLTNLGINCRQRGDFKAAINYLERVTQSGPGNMALWLNLSAAYDQAGLEGKAQQAMIRAQQASQLRQ